MNTEAPAAPTADTPAPATHEEMRGAQTSAGAAERFRDAVQFGLDRGVIDRARAEKEMQDAGNTLPLKDGPKAADAASPSSDGGGGGVESLPGFEPGKAADFQLPDTAELHALTSPKGAAPLTSAQTLEIQATVGAWGEAMRFPAAIGSSLTKMAGDHIKAMPNYDALDDNAKQTYELVERGKLEKLWGDKTNENLSLARKLAHEMAAKDPRFANFVNGSGVGNNSAFIAQMAMQAKRLAAKAR